MSVVERISQGCRRFWMVCASWGTWKVLRRLPGNHIEETVFYTGLGLYLVLQGILILVPLWTQTAIPGFDDAYSYINKSVQMEACFRQDCPALTDLRRQLDVMSSNPEIARLSQRAHQRALLIYHPLYSILLLGLERVGLTWEASYKLLWGLGAVFIGLVLAYWLRTLWRPAPAGIALGLLAFQVFPGQGLHYVVPSNLALGVMLLIWARLVARRGHAPWSLALGALVLTTLHSAIGLFCALVLAGILMLLAGWPRTLRAAWPLVTVGLIIGASLLLPAVVRQPELSVRLVPFPATAGAWISFLATTIADVARVIATWVTPLGAVPVGATILLGYATVIQGEANSLFKTTVVVIVMILLSLVYITPGYPAEVFRRVWILFVVLVTGAVGQSVWYLLGQLRAAGAQLFQHPDALVTFIGGAIKLSPYPWIKLSVLALCLVAAVVVYIAAGGTPLRSAMAQMQSYRSVFDPAQPSRLASLAKPGDRVLYLHETQLLFYLTYGGLNVGAVYYPVIAATPAEAQWLQNPEVRFVVAWNPVESLEVNGPDTIAVAPLRWLRLETREAVAVPHLRLYLENGGAQAQVRVRQLAPACDQPAAADIPANASNWVVVKLPCIAATELFEISFLPENNALRMGGLTLGDDSHRWPWAQKAQLTLASQEASAAFTTLSFDPVTLLPDALQSTPVDVLEDQGATVLLRLER